MENIYMRRMKEAYKRFSSSIVDQWKLQMYDVQLDYIVTGPLTEFLCTKADDLVKKVIGSLRKAYDLNN